MGKDLKGNTLPDGIVQRKNGNYRGRFQYKGEVYTRDNADLKELIQQMEGLRYEVKHGLKGKGDNVTLNAWFDVWLNTHKRKSIKESSGGEEFVFVDPVIKIEQERRDRGVGPS